MDTVDQKPKRTDSLRLTREFNEKFFRETLNRIQITNLSVIIDDIRDYRTLSEDQITQLGTMSESEKIEIIKAYNTAFVTLEHAVNR